MNLSKAILVLTGLVARAVHADKDDFEPSFRMVEWNDDMVKGSAPQSIIGGDYIEPGSRPWLVPVVGKYFCGGSLISPRAVMTVGECAVRLFYYSLLGSALINST